MGQIDVEKYCTSAWVMEVVLKLDPSEDANKASDKFNAKCTALAKEEDQQKLPIGPMCFRQTDGQHFVKNPNKKSKDKFLAQPMDVAVRCIAARAKDEAWVKFKPDVPVVVAKPVELAAPSTPTVVELPKVVTPADAKPADAPKPASLPVDVTPVDASSSFTGWLGVFTVLTGTAPTHIGMSVNGQDALHSFSAPVYFGATLGLVSPEIALIGLMTGRLQLNAVFEYIKFSSDQDQEYSRNFSVMNFGPKLSAQGIYPSTDDMRIFFGPYVEYQMGGLSTDGTVEVAKGKGYDTDGKSSWITSLMYGGLIGAEQTPTAGKRVAGFAQVSAGMRHFFWGAKPSSQSTMQMDKAGLSAVLEIGVKFK